MSPEIMRYMVTMFLTIATVGSQFIEDNFMLASQSSAGYWELLEITLELRGISHLRCAAMCSGRPLHECVGIHSCNDDVCRLRGSHHATQSVAGADTPCEIFYIRGKSPVLRTSDRIPLITRHL
jgi:hypothetical protein